MLRLTFAASIVLLIVLSSSSQEILGRTTNPKSAPRPTDKVRTLCVVIGHPIKLVRPNYPLAAKVVGARGVVEVLVVIDKHGRVIKADARNGHPLLRSASVKAALLSVFQPVTLSGRRIKVTGIITYVYKS